MAPKKKDVINYDTTNAAGNIVLKAMLDGDAAALLVCKDDISILSSEEPTTERLVYTDPFAAAAKLDCSFVLAVDENAPVKMYSKGRSFSLESFSRTPLGYPLKEEALVFDLEDHAKVITRVTGYDSFEDAEADIGRDSGSSERTFTLVTKEGLKKLQDAGLPAPVNGVSDLGKVKMGVEFGDESAASVFDTLSYVSGDRSLIVPLSITEPLRRSYEKAREPEGTLVGPSFKEKLDLIDSEVREPGYGIAVYSVLNHHQPTGSETSVSRRVFMDASLKDVVGSLLDDEHFRGSELHIEDDSVTTFVEHARPKGTESFAMEIFQEDGSFCVAKASSEEFSTDSFETESADEELTSIRLLSPASIEPLLDLGFSAKDGIIDLGDTNDGALNLRAAAVFDIGFFNERAHDGSRLSYPLDVVFDAVKDEVESSEAAIRAKELASASVICPTEPEAEGPDYA